MDEACNIQLPTYSNLGMHNLTAAMLYCTHYSMHNSCYDCIYHVCIMHNIMKVCILHMHMHACVN